jgi:hypothetical protein
MFDYILPVCITLLIPLVAGKIGASLVKFNEFRKVVSENSNKCQENSNNDFFNSCFKSSKILLSTFQSVVYQNIWGLSKIHFPLCTYSPPSTSKFICIYHNMKWYKVPLHMKRGPVTRNISCISYNGLNITDDIIQFAGPLNDFFGLGITPAFFGIRNMNITCNGEEYIFNRDTPIVFSDENKVRDEDDFILPIGDESVDSTLVDSTLVDSTLVDSTLVDSTLVDSTLVDSTLVDSTLVESTLVDSTLVDSTLVESTPVDSTPVESTPVESTPVESTPVESTPVESTPVESTPVESNLTLNIDISIPVSPSIIPHPPNNSPNNQ